MMLQYSNKILIGLTLLGVSFLGLAAAIMLVEGNYIVGLVHGAIGLVYVITYLYQKYVGYAVLSEEWINRNDILSKQILVSEIQSIKRFADEVTITSANNKIKFNTSVMAVHSKEQFENFITKLEQQTSRV